VATGLQALYFYALIDGAKLLGERIDLALELGMTGAQALHNLPVLKGFRTGEG
jgi:hypothetical protein